MSVVRPRTFLPQLECSRPWGARCLLPQGVLLGSAAGCWTTWEYTSATAPNSTARLSDADIGVAKSRCLAVVKTLAQTGVATPSRLMLLAPAVALFLRSSAVTPQEVHEALSVDFILAGYNAYDAALPDSRHTLGSTNDEAGAPCTKKSTPAHKHAQLARVRGFNNPRTPILLGEPRPHVNCAVICRPGGMPILHGLRAGHGG